MNQNPQKRQYVRFVSAAIEYNEELRLLRSRSVVPFVKRCRNADVEPYHAFRDTLALRTTAIAEKYEVRK
jgi:hypothetical protein